MWDSALRMVSSGFISSESLLGDMFSDMSRLENNQMERIQFALSPDLLKSALAAVFVWKTSMVRVNRSYTVHGDQSPSEKG